MIKDASVLTALSLYHRRDEEFQDEVIAYYSRPPGIWSFDPLFTYVECLFRGMSPDVLLRQLDQKYHTRPQWKPYRCRLIEIVKWKKSLDVRASYAFSLSSVLSGQTKFKFPKSLVYIIGDQAFLLVPYYLKDSGIFGYRENLLFGLLRDQLSSKVEGDGLTSSFLRFYDGRIMVSSSESAEVASRDEVNSMLVSFGKVYANVSRISQPTNKSKSPTKDSQLSLAL